MSTPTPDSKTLIDRLFAVGAHFGFSKSRRHPTVKPYLYGNKQGTDIFDLEKSAALIETAKEVIKKAGSEGKVVLFVATKDEASRVVKTAAEKIAAPYVTNRWIGGILTNFSEIKKRIDRLLALIAEGESGELERKYTKKERVLIGRELTKLEFNFGGIKQLERVPQMMVVVDPRHDAIAVREAQDSGLPVIGIMSSDNNTSQVTYPVVVNDALQASISLVLDELIAAYEAGKKEYTPKTNTRGEHSRNRGPRVMSRS